MLKLVYQADPIIQEPPQQEHIMSIPRTPFKATVRLSGPNLYMMQAQDTSHYLSCDITIEIEESQYKGEPGAVICHFPEILDEQLNAFIWEDETLYAIILIQFQMKLMKELLAFCKTHYVSRLVIYPDDTQAEDFGIFQDFLIVEDLTCEEEEEQTKMVIPATSETYDNWIEFMNEANLRFQQTLWRNQRKNPAIKQYLIAHPFGQGWQET